MSPDPIIDDDNPEWTDADFARAQTADTLPPEILAAFPRTVRGSQSQGVGCDQRGRRQVVSGRGADWESRIDEVLRKAIAG